MFLYVGSGEKTDLCRGTYVGYQIVLAFLLRMCPGPSIQSGPKLENETKTKGKT